MTLSVPIVIGERIAADVAERLLQFSYTDSKSSSSTLCQRVNSRTHNYAHLSPHHGHAGSRPRLHLPT